MRTTRTGLLLIALLAGLAGVSPLAQKDGGKPAMQPVELPALVADDADRIALDAHGEGALLTISGRAFDSLWHRRGGKIEPVTFENGDRVVGEQIYVQLDGNPAIVEYHPGGQLDQQYLLVKDGKASELLTHKGERFRPNAPYAFRDAGITLFSVPGTGETESFFLLIDDAVRPLLDAEGGQVKARMVALSECADGRIRAVVWQTDGNFPEYFLEGNKLMPIPEAKLPEEGWTSASNFFPSGGRVVTALNAELGKMRAVVSADNPRWISNAESIPIEHTSLVGRTVGNELYLFGSKKDEEGSSTTSVYHVRDGVAKAVTGAGIALRNLQPHVVGRRLFASNKRGDGSYEMLIIHPQGIERVLTPNGEVVQPSGEVAIVTADTRTLMRYRGESRSHWGVLEGTTVQPIAVERKWYPPEFGDWAWEVGGKLYLRWEEVADGQQYQWFGELTPEYELVPLVSASGVLRGDEVTALKDGSDLLVSFRGIKGGASLFRIGG